MLDKLEIEFNEYGEIVLNNLATSLQNEMDCNNAISLEDRFANLMACGKTLNIPCK